MVKIPGFPGERLVTAEAGKGNWLVLCMSPVEDEACVRICSVWPLLLLSQASKVVCTWPLAENTHVTSPQGQAAAQALPAHLAQCWLGQSD